MLKNLLLMAVCLLWVSKGISQNQPGQPATADSTLKTVKLEKTFRVAATDRLEIAFRTPATVIITGWDRNEVNVKVDMKGKHLQFAHRQENNTLLLATNYQMPDRALFASGTVEVKVPKRMMVRGRLMEGGEVNLSGLAGETNLETTLGSITAGNLDGRVNLVTQNGYVRLEGGNIEGQLSALQGGVQVKNSRGKFSVGGPSGQFSVESPREMVEGSIEADSVKLIVKEGDVQASSYQGKLAVSWQGDKRARQRKIQLFAQQSEVVLRLPDGFGMDAFVEQMRSEEARPTASEQSPTGTSAHAAPVSEPGKRDTNPQNPAYVYQWKGDYQYNHEYTYSFESDYEWKDFPSEKDFTHQGRKGHLVQARKSFAGGGNQVDIRTMDSRIVLKKL